MIDKKLFIDEIEKLNVSSSTNEKLLKLYDLYLDLQLGGKIASDLPDELLNELFKSAYDAFSIPMSFINSYLGEVLFTVKFGCRQENSFTPIEVALLTSRTKALISHDMNNGKLNYKRHGQGKSIIISERDLFKYMKDKGFTESQCNERLGLFLKLKQKDLKLNEIKKWLDDLKIGD